MAEIEFPSNIRFDPISPVLLPPKETSEPCVTGETRDQSPRRQSDPGVFGRNFFSSHPDTDQFVKKMQGALHETNSYKNQCIEAARVSPARHQREAYNWEVFRRSAADARSASKVARGVENTGRQQLGSRPQELGHLSFSSRRPGMSGETEFVLPGAVEAFRDPNDWVQDDFRQWETGIRGPKAGIGVEAKVNSKSKAEAKGEEGIPRNERDLEVQDEDSELSTAQPSEDTSPLLPYTQDASRGSSKFPDNHGRSRTGSMVSVLTCPGAELRKPPSLRFKILAQFNERFKPSDSKGVIKAASKDRREEEMADVKFADEDVHDSILGWVKHKLGFDIKTKSQLETGFPLIVLTALDAVYGNRVKWTEVDWELKYARATWKNLVIMQNIWEEVSMDSLREFRPEATSLRLEAMFKAPVRERCDFLKLLQRWFHKRVPESEPYNAMARRCQYAEQCRLWGKEIKFPSWIIYEEQIDPVHHLQRRRSLVERPNSSYLKMPEFRRLSWFLGSHEQPSM
mmetsp:Transcript_68678/g.135894  ORF Transcript_68678/g.135894 Transcript_68678/m.135894 type:complete len:513 (-) Transcript_68678:153-1691(-)